MYLDTAILVKLLVRESESDFYVALVDGQPTWSSSLIVVECFSALLRSLDAIHLASAERCQSWPLCSNDARVRAAAARLGLPLSPLPA